MILFIALFENLFKFWWKVDLWCYYYCISCAIENFALNVWEYRRIVIIINECLQVWFRKDRMYADFISIL